MSEIDDISFVLSESGHLYSFGSNSEGQLGTGDTDSNIATPQLIKGIKPTKFKMITAGTDHAAALTGMILILVLSLFGFL